MSFKTCSPAGRVDYPRKGYRIRMAKQNENETAIAERCRCTVIEVFAEAIVYTLAALG